MSVADDPRDRLACRFDARVLRTRLAAREPELVAIDRERTSFDGLGQRRKPGGQARLKRLQVGLRVGRQVEIADETLSIALPELQGNEPVLGRLVGQAMSDGDRPVPQRALEGDQGRGAKAAQRRGPVRLVDKTLPRCAERLCVPLRQMRRRMTLRGHQGSQTRR